MLNGAPLLLDIIYTLSLENKCWYNIMLTKISFVLLVIFFILVIMYFININFSTVEGMGNNPDGDDNESSGNISHCNYSKVNKTIDEIQDMITKNTDAIQQIQQQIEKMESS
jgi:hypothetical protein